MKTVVVSGWKVGFQKVKFTEMLRRDLGYSLSEAKAKTDAVLDNHRLELHVQNTDYPKVLAQLSDLGAKYVSQEQE